jgi:hypothetical protein
LTSGAISFGKNQLELLGFVGCDDRNLKTQYKSNDPGGSIQRGRSERGYQGVNGDWERVNGGFWIRDKALILQGFTVLMPCLAETRTSGIRDLVDDLLDEDDLDVDAAGDVGQEFGDEVVSRGESVAGDDAGSRGG